MKKWLIVAIVVVVVSATAGIIATRDGNSETITLDASSDSLQIPDDGPRLEVVVNFPKELTMEWEELTTNELHLVFDGAVKNISSRTIEGIRMLILLDGEEISHWPPFGEWTLGPEEKMDFHLGKVVSPDTLRSSKLIEVTVKDFRVVGNTETVAPQPTQLEEPEPITPEAIIPKPDMTPEETALEWYRLMRAKSFAAVMELYTPEAKEKIISLGGIESLKRAWRENEIIKMTIETHMTEIIQEDSEAYVYALVDHSDGVTDDRIGFLFRQIDDQWKLEEDIVDEF